MKTNDIFRLRKIRSIGYNSGNSRNGFYDRTINTTYGKLNIKIPRDRIGEFNQA